MFDLNYFLDHIPALLFGASSTGALFIGKIIEHAKNDAVVDHRLISIEEDLKELKASDIRLEDKIDRIIEKI